MIENDDRILQFMKEYYSARVNKDMDVLKTLDPILDVEKEKGYLDNSVIEEYYNIATYSNTNMDLNSAVVYVYYEAKVKEIATLVPSLSQFYLVLDGEQYYIGDYMRDERSENYVKNIRESSEVQQLTAQVIEKLSKAEESDAELRSFMGGDIEEPLKENGDDVKVSTLIGSSERHDNVS